MFAFLKKRCRLIGSLTFLACSIFAAWYLAYQYANYSYVGLHCTANACVEVYRPMLGADRLTLFLQGMIAACFGLAAYHIALALGAWWFKRSAEYRRLQGQLDRAKTALKVGGDA